MKVASQIARLLLGFIFMVFGLNGFLHFIPMPPPTGTAAQFFGSLAATPYLAIIMLLQLISGILLLINRYVALALTVLAPIIVNILLFHTFLAPAGLPLAVLVALLWLAAAWPIRSVYAGLLRNKQP